MKLSLEIIEQSGRAALTAAVDVILSDIDRLKLTEADKTAFTEPYTDEQTDYFNRGIESVAARLRDIRDGLE